MLSLKQFDVELRRLQLEDIELIRKWRNEAHVAQQMIYREYITTEMQLKWFNSINNPYNYYFLILYKDMKVGLIHAKDYNLEKGFGEGGIFIGDKSYEDSYAAVFASLGLLNFVFYLLPHITKSRIRVLKTNKRAIQYNKLIGYEEISGAKNTHDQLFELSRERYLTHGLKLNKVASLYCEGSNLMELNGTSSELNMREINSLLDAKIPPTAIPGL
ncbi:MAG: GNAT family N-acetyltransferase [Crocinitomicaceae bacterium]